MIDPVVLWTNMVCGHYERTGRVHTVPRFDLAKSRKLAWLFFLYTVTKRRFHDRPLPADIDT